MFHMPTNRYRPGHTLLINDTNLNPHLPLRTELSQAELSRMDELVARSSKEIR
jgi:hypothetical protein